MTQKPFTFSNDPNGGESGAGFATKLDGSDGGQFGRIDRLSTIPKIRKQQIASAQLIGVDGCDARIYRIPGTDEYPAPAFGFVIP